MKRPLLIVAAILALAAAGCKDKPQEEAPSAAVPQVTSPAPAQTSPAAAPPSPSTAVGHKGRVIATLNGGTYTLIQVEENGRKIWLGARQNKISVGDEIEYPESPFVEKLKNKTLKRTFDKVYFVETFKVNGK